MRADDSPERIRHASRRCKPGPSAPKSPRLSPQVLRMFQMRHAARPGWPLLPLSWKSRLRAGLAQIAQKHGCPRCRRCDDRPQRQSGKAPTQQGLKRPCPWWDPPPRGPFGPTDSCNSSPRRRPCEKFLWFRLRARVFIILLPFTIQTVNTCSGFYSLISLLPPLPPRESHHLHSHSIGASNNLGAIAQDFDSCRSTNRTLRDSEKKHWNVWFIFYLEYNKVFEVNLMISFSVLFGMRIDVVKRLQWWPIDLAAMSGRNFRFPVEGNRFPKVEWFE